MAPSCQYQVALYVAGFPCTPYSGLGKTELLQDPNAEQLFETIRRLRRIRPAVTWTLLSTPIITNQCKFWIRKFHPSPLAPCSF